MRVWCSLSCALALGLACSPQNDGCTQLQSKLDSCGLYLSSGPSLVCDSSASSVDRCRMQCILDLPCAELTPTKKDDPYVICEKDCYPWGADAFVCDDLSGFVAKAEMCDGKQHCADGSDTKNCPSKDGGTDGSRESGSADAAKD